jgi:hypothetical protein
VDDSGWLTTWEKEMAKVKLSAAVIAANQLKAEKIKALAIAEDAVKVLKDEVSLAYVSARKAQEEDDSKLPQCNMVSVGWRTAKETPAGRVVIVRKTPTGFLIVRRVGEVDSDFKFKFENGDYVSAGRSYFSDRTMLRNIPAEFQPN